MTTEAVRATKHWAWDRVAPNFYAAVVHPSDECDTRYPVTITVTLERGGKAGGWWVHATDSVWPAHSNTFADAMAKAERIRLAREAELLPATVH